MKKLTFNENGEAIDEQTGQIIGKKDSSGKLVFDAEKIRQIEEANKDNHNSSVDLSDVGRNDEPEKILRTSIKPAPKYTKYEISPDSEFTVRFCLGFEEEKILVYKEDSYLRIDGLERHWAKFRMWNFREELEWKNQCMEFDSISRAFKQNIIKLNEIKIRRLIKDWSFSEIDPKFKLLHVDGVLSDESYNVMMGFNPAIMDNLIVLMNNVLE